MRQRVKLAQAIVHDPELLILDEPLSGMDPIARRRTIRLIKDWARAGKSVLVSSHILHEIEAMTSNILLINNGRILAEGDVHHIRELIDEHPHTVHVRAARPRDLAREFLTRDDVLSLTLEQEAIVIQTSKPDSFYRFLTELAASGPGGRDRRGRPRRTTTSRPCSSTWSNERHALRPDRRPCRSARRARRRGRAPPGAAVPDGGDAGVRPVARPDALVPAHDLPRAAGRVAPGARHPVPRARDARRRRAHQARRRRRPAARPSSAG